MLGFASGIVVRQSRHMTSRDPDPTASLLRRLAAGDANAANELLPVVYEELHRIANRLMQRQRDSHTLQPTALIHEAYLKIVAGDNGYAGRGHFMRVAATAMRSVLIDHARANDSQKRGGKRRAVTLYESEVGEAVDVDRALAIDEGIRGLAEIDGQLAEIVELRFFGGFSNPEIAKLLSVPLRSIERGWQFARTWLKQYLESSQ